MAIIDEINKRIALGIKAKLLIGFLTVIILAVGILAIVSGQRAQQAIYKELEDNLTNTAQLVEGMVSVRQSLLAEKLVGDLNVALQMLHDLGPVRVDQNDYVQVGTYWVPRMYAGQQSLTLEYSLVDDIQRLVGGTATIFIHQGDELVRISTNVLTNQGQRGIGTTITSQSPVYQAIMKKETYYGRAWVVNGWYISGYAPITTSNGQIVGAIYVGIREQDPYLQERINQVQIGQSGYVFVVDSRGDFVLHPTRQGENVFEEEFVKEIMYKKDGVIEFEQDGLKKIASYTYFEPWNWHIVAVADFAEMEAPVKSLVETIIKVSGAIIIGAILIAIGIANSLVAPINRLKNYMDHASKGDLTVKSDISNKDEIGVLSESFNQMIENNKNLVADLNIAIQQMTSATEQVSRAAEESNASMTAVASNVDRVAWGAQANASALKETSKGADEVAITAQQVFSAAQGASEDSKKATEEVAHALKVIDKVAATVDDLDKGRIEIGRVVEDLVKATEGIAGFVTDITAIAEQTNLLALNAAIEAARAGENGRGFAVVAEEVRSLAEDAAKSAQEIQQLIQDVQGKTSLAVATSEKTGQLITSTVNQVEGVKARIGQVVGQIDGVNNSIQEMRGAAEEQSALSQEMTASVNDVTRVIEETASSAQEIAAGVQEQASALEQIGATMEELDSMAQSLLEKISAFKIK